MARPSATNVARIKTGKNSLAIAITRKRVTGAEHLVHADVDGLSDVGE